MALSALSAALAEVPRNSHAWTYTIAALDGSPYLTRTLLPRLGRHRVMLHRIHRKDADPWPHNHPWRDARFLVLSGGYTEERDGATRVLRPGDVNALTAETFHRVTHVEPNTWTLGLIGERVQDWGFRVDEVLVPHAEYFAQQRYADRGGLS